MNDQPRDIRIALTRDEYVSLKACVTGELESLTEADWDSGGFDDLDRADQALNRAWKRAMRRHNVRV